MREQEVVKVRREEKREERAQMGWREDTREARTE